MKSKKLNLENKKRSVASSLPKSKKNKYNEEKFKHKDSISQTSKKLDEKETVRLQKYLAQCSVASRRAAEHLIETGEVKVNGKIAKLGDKVNPKKDVVTINDKKIKLCDKKYYIMLNKPRGFVTTMKDEKNRKCVADLVKDLPVKLYPVGRLDKDSEGLLLMTNDGDFANDISHPKSHISKTYRVTVKPGITEDQMTKMLIGMEIDGRISRPASVQVVSQREDRDVIEIVLTEGRNRQIRKMCESLGLEVAKLKRIKIGQLKLGMLKIGDWRELSKDEISNLR